MPFCVLSLQAQLAVSVSPVQVTGQKAIVPLAITNHFNQKIESARAGVFVLDDQKKVVAQGTRWVIGGGTNTHGLAPGATNAFYFVVNGSKPITGTNLTAEVIFSRVVPRRPESD